MYLSDCCFLEMEINIKRSHVVFKKSTYRNWKKADMEKVCAQLADLDKKLNYDTQCLTEFLEDYQGSLNSIINGHQRYIKGIDMSNVDYRPVSNLPFLSKLVEKCVLIQFNNHLKIEYFECGTSKCLQGRSQL